MASDPLSSTTHKARTYLLGLSAAGLLTHYYGLTVEDIPLAGLKITVTENLVPLALTIGIGYFLLCFIIYAVDDVINLTNTPYQERIVSAFSEQQDAIRKDTILAIESSLSGSDVLSFFDRATDRHGTLAAEIWDLASPMFHQDHFLDLAMNMLAVHFHITGDEKEKGEGRIRRLAFQSAMDALLEARQKINFHRSVARSPSYVVYRWFRVWVFDLALAPVVAIAALTVMWWPNA